MKFTCYYCGDKKVIVSFIEDGMVPGTSMKKRNPCCHDCLTAPAIDGKPSHTHKDVGTDAEHPSNPEEEEYPF